MKYSLFILMLLVATLSGCVKDRFCKCVAISGGSKTLTFAKTKKSDATKACNRYAADFQDKYSSCSIESANNEK